MDLTIRQPEKVKEAPVVTPPPFVINHENMNG